MRVSISDSAPGCSPARNTYLTTRVSRTFEPYARRLVGADLSVSHDGVLHEGRLVLRIAAAPPVVLASKGRRMVNVLANLFEAAEDRLGASFPSERPRGEAV